MDARVEPAHDTSSFGLRFSHYLEIVMAGLDPAIHVLALA